MNQSSSWLNKLLNYRHSVLLLFVFAFISRIFYGFYSPGAAFVDDYLYIIKPAIHKLQTGEEFVFPALRNAIYAQIYYFIFRVAQWFGVTTPVYLTGLANAIIGIFSVWGLWGLYKLTEIFLERPYRILVLLIAVIHPIMPLLSTKSLVESYAMFVIPGAFYFLLKDDAKSKDFFLAGILFGLSAFFRLQTGIIVAGASVFLTVNVIQKNIEWNKWWSFHIAGSIILIFLGVSDLFFGKHFMESTWAYLEYNFLTNVADSQWGSVPWYSYLALFSALFIPPFSFLLIPSFFRSMKPLKLIFTLFVIFVLIHSMIENKLERFMAPVIPLFFLLVIAGYQERAKNAFRKWEEFSLHASIIIMIILLPLALTQRSQITMINAAAFLRNDNTAHHSVFMSEPTWFHAYTGFDFKPPINEPDFQKAEKISSSENFYFITRDVSFDQKNCKKKITLNPDLVEALAYRFNPSHNKRRAPLHIYYCRKNL